LVLPKNKVASTLSGVSTLELPTSERLHELYPEAELDAQRRRYSGLVQRLSSELESSTEGAFFVSAPGRTELGGNHTDHQQGRVLAASINLDTIAAVVPRKDRLVRIASEGYEPFTLDLRGLEPVPDEKGRPASLVRGVAAELSKLGYHPLGFDATVSSSVLPGSGLSSSASFEVLVASIWNHLCADGSLDAVSVARMGYVAENQFFGKPCGLMDQVACAHGGIVAIDFEDNEHPTVSPVSFSFDEAGYRLLVVDTGGSHADLTEDYAAVPSEMRAVANYFSRTVLREVDPSRFMASVPELRRELGDRAVLRALHFFEENERVPKMLRALEKEGIRIYLSLVGGSAGSSWKLLQNSFSPKEPSSQGISLAIALSESFFAGEKARGDDARLPGVARVHGGGFAGSTQVYVRADLADRYMAYIEPVFGAESVQAIRVREAPAGLV
jgi:galactokinase